MLVFGSVRYAWATHGVNAIGLEVRLWGVGSGLEGLCLPWVLGVGSGVTCVRLVVRWLGWSPDSCE